MDDKEKSIVEFMLTFLICQILFSVTAVTISLHYKKILILLSPDDIFDISTILALLAAVIREILLRRINEKNNACCHNDGTDE